MAEQGDSSADAQRARQLIPVVLLALVVAFAVEMVAFARFGVFDILGPAVSAIVVMAEAGALALVAFLLVRAKR